MEQQFILPYIISNLVALLLLFATFKWRHVARILFAILFIWAALANWRMAHNNPADYLSYSKYAIGFYKTIINGAFANNITPFVSFVAICQFLIGLGLLSKGIVFRTACIGAIIFLVAISPLGIGSAFPCGLILAAGLYKLAKHPFPKTIFNNKWAY